MNDDWIGVAWGLMAEGKLDDAHRMLVAVVEENDSPMVHAQSPHDRWPSIAAACLCLAGIAYRRKLFGEALAWAQHAVVRSRDAPVVAHLIAAHAHLRMGDVELATSKFDMVVAMSDRDIGLGVLAMIGLSDIPSEER